MVAVRSGAIRYGGWLIERVWWQRQIAGGETLPIRQVGAKYRTTVGHSQSFDQQFDCTHCLLVMQNSGLLHRAGERSSDTALHPKPLAPDDFDAHGDDFPYDLLTLALQRIRG
jgi:hypothetical protein